MKLASFNVENLFDRAGAMNQDAIAFRKGLVGSGRSSMSV
jgi:hypothetical protein